MLCIFPVQDQQAFKKQGIVIDDMVTAQRRDEFCQPAGGYGRGLFAQFRLHPVHDSIDLGSVSVDNAAAHAVDGVFSNNLIRCGQADVGQLGSFPLKESRESLRPGRFTPPM